MTPPPFTRRTLLVGAVVGVAGRTLAVRDGSASAASTSAPGFADFQAQIGSTFRLRDADGRVHSLRLVEATLTPVRSRARGRGEAYSLVFRGDSAERAASAMHALRHPTLGTVELFVGPVGPRRNYEAVVNHWRPASAAA